MASILTDDEISTVKHFFTKADKDGNGKLSRDEMRKLLEQLNGIPLSDETVEEAFKGFDLDKDGQVDLNDMLKDAEKKKPAKIAAIKSRFDSIDTDGNGYITKDEVREVFKKVMEKAIEGTMDVIDADKDGNVSYDEFLKYMNVKIVFH